MSVRKSLKQAMFAIDNAFAEHAQVCPACEKDSPSLCKVGLALLRRLQLVVHSQIVHDQAKPMSACGLCGGSGWKQVSNNGTLTVVRCSCCKKGAAAVTPIPDYKSLAAGDRE